MDLAAALENIVNSNRGTPLANKIGDALAKVQAAHGKRQAGDRQGALGELEGAAGDIEAAIAANPAFAAQGTSLLQHTIVIARSIAVEAIQVAVAGNGDPVKIGEANAALEDGDLKATNGRYKDAVARYKDAVAKADSS
jgi:hypothetical protein